ncbi:MAG: RNA polymerase sigma factor [Deltaproteobacteria bacterium]|nr:RNA polymerase sigma factor [Deltaproteobacteria bacterium]
MPPTSLSHAAKTSIDPLPVEAPPERTSEVRRGLGALRGELLARALRLCRSRAGAEDLVQETSERALRFEHQFQGGTNLRAWLNQVMLRAFLTRCRGARRERRALDRLAADPSGWPEAPPLPTRAGLPRQAERALASLPAGYREAIVLVDLEDQSYRDAAERLGVPIGTVMSRLHRGRRHLAAMLADAA